jgi:hypothetical protein
MVMGSTLRCAMVTGALERACKHWVYLEAFKNT